jgi:hypothetical protein
VNSLPPPRDPAAVRVSTAGQLLAVIPALLGGTEPDHSLVVVAAAPPHGKVIGIICCPLPDTPDLTAAYLLAADICDTLAHDGAAIILAAGYGAGPLVTPVADALRAAAGQAGLQLTECLRVEDGQYWSYLCPGTCHPAEAQVPPPLLMPGTASGPAAARAEAAASVMALSGVIAEQMAAETRRCERIASAYLAMASAAPGTAAAGRVISKYGIPAVTATIRAYRDDSLVPPASAFAWLSVTLAITEVRDAAWSQMDPAHAAAHQRLWTDLVRRARPGYVAAPAALLAFTAWQAGDIVLAGAALDRAQADDPDDSMASVFRRALSVGVPPHLAVPPSFQAEQPGTPVGLRPEPAPPPSRPGEYMAELFDHGDSTYSLRVVVLPDNDDRDARGRPVMPLAVVLDPLPIADENREGAKHTAQHLLAEHAFTASGAWAWERDGHDWCHWVNVVRTRNEASA